MHTGIICIKPIYSIFFMDLVNYSCERYPNSDSKPYSVLPDRTGIYNKTLPGTYQWETHNPDLRDNLTYLGPTSFKAPPRQYALAPNYPKENYGPTIFSRIVIDISYCFINWVGIIVCPCVCMPNILYILCMQTFRILDPVGVYQQRDMFHTLPSKPIHNKLIVCVWHC